MADGVARPCWQNCGGVDKEVLAIDAMEDSIAPVDEQATQIRQLITRFEACYHEADKEAEFIAAAIGAGHSPQRSNARPAQRRRELENTRRILATWCENPTIEGMAQDVGGIRASELLGFIGEPSALKTWLVSRVVDRISHALDPNHPYRNLALNVGDYGEPGPGDVGSCYVNDSAFLRRTRETLIRDTVDGRESKISLAFAIDLLMPCGWDFVGCLVTILKAIGGDPHPTRPFACCARNVRLSPLCDRLTTISDTLRVFWKDEAISETTDQRLLESLGTPTPVKRWLTASLDKTIRLHLTQPFEMELF